MKELIRFCPICGHAVERNVDPFCYKHEKGDRQLEKWEAYLSRGHDRLAGGDPGVESCRCPGCRQQIVLDPLYRPAFCYFCGKPLAPTGRNKGWSNVARRASKKYSSVLRAMAKPPTRRKSGGQ